MKKLLYAFILLFAMHATGQDYEGIISSYLNDNRSQLQLQTEDISDITVNSDAYSKSMDVTNVYASQQYQGISIFNAVGSFAVKNNTVVYSNINNFKKNIATKTNSTNPSITAEVAITKAAQSLGLANPTNISLLESIGSNNYVYSNGAISRNDIPVQLVYTTVGDELRLAWDLSIFLTDMSHYYSVRIDAMTGDMLDIADWIHNCSFGTAPHSGHNNPESILIGDRNRNQEGAITNGGASYRVFPHPFENPDETDDQLVVSPENLTASPFGWHDTNGATGAEFTYTRGNNVDAHDDIEGDNNIEQGPDGGSTLEFDFPYDLPQEPINHLDASIVNLFYWNNIAHDISYLYGFDEASGNFQQNNYGNGGSQGDYVFAQAQDGAGTNNAVFGSPPDGDNGVMQMYLWSAPGDVLGTLLTINSGPLAGQYLAFDSNFNGTELPTTPITEDLALMEDDDAGASTDPYDGCDNITNPADLNGKIAVVRRGECNFTDKVSSAEAAGAVAVIVVNNTPGDPIPMGGAGSGIGIPAVMIYQGPGEDIIASLLDGDTINATLVDDGSASDPFQRDGDLDAEIIVHEYTHGISNRLTGGRLLAGCLQTCTQQSGGNCTRFSEQMGEGWSDWFGMMFTMQASDNAEDLRGFATYSVGQGAAGNGLRPYPYTTDTTYSPLTYGDIDNATLSVPHGVGSVWASMLWDLTWALIDEYGFDPDIYNGTGGNNIAIQLVMDGMKLQPCQPGFEDGRDAILEADELLNGGANRCLIWEVFAARGLGVDADQGSPLDRTDGTEGFEIPEGENCTLSADDRSSYDNNFRVYPNPSNGIINIKSVLEVGQATVSIYDMNGRSVYSEVLDLNQVVQINAGNLSAGVYVVQIDGTNYTHTAKLLMR
ncbi:T9SS-dependent M36 family metallopeptidase [Luteirhabdus pelagi]|uniref:T9SS-dependent M36 family metallopeptidase n=1 Tax=Luteirhabdus pelagi TaxID=2792783 RepID=UPI00193995D4|nr:T9SS-dependent M36 family metallopeptidase [Luteirhabdus pelagi]